MIGNFNNDKRKADLRTLLIIVFGALLTLWLVTPPGNKFAQLCFYGNNTKFVIAKYVQKVDVDEWIFHRNNAVYLAKMNNKRSALKEINLAFKTIPSYVDDSKYYALCRDSAIIKLYLKEYSAALNDFQKLPSRNMVDNLRVAMLYRKLGNYKEAARSCNEILKVDYEAYSGYACLASLYGDKGRYSTSIKIYDLLISRNSNRGKFYLDRAEYKKLQGDLDGYNNDVKKAESLNANIESNLNILEDAINPKSLDLTMKNS